VKVKILNMTTKPKTKSAVKPAVKAKAPVPVRGREKVFEGVCTLLEQGMSLTEACKKVPDAPLPSSVLKWIDQDPQGLGQRYALARETGYRLLGDEITRIASETHAIVYVQKRDAAGNLMHDEDGEPLLEKAMAPLSADVMAHKRLMVDTLKWKLAKMLPKIYGDKVTQEHTGAGGGPIQMAAVNLKNLNDDELAQMQKLMSKAGEAK
jgi:hypothetical protein